MIYVPSWQSVGKDPLKITGTCIYMYIYTSVTVTDHKECSFTKCSALGKPRVFRIQTWNQSPLNWHSGHWTVNQWMFWRVQNIIGQIWRLVVHVLQTLGTVSMWINNSLSRERHNITIINKKFANNTSSHLLYFSPCLN